MYRKLSPEDLQLTITTLRKCNGNRTEAAKILGISYQGITARLRKLGLTRSHIQETWLKYSKTKDLESRNYLIEHYLFLVKQIAKKLYYTLPNDVQEDDLIQAGTIGLMGAIDAFDVTRDIKFETYAPARIRGAMLDELRNQDIVPRLTRQHIKTRKQAEEFLFTQIGEPPSPEAVTDYLGWSQNTYRDSFPKTQISLEKKLGETDSFKEIREIDVLIGKLPEDTSIDLEARVREMLKGLSLEETLIMYLYYWKDNTMKVIGQVLHLSESRVSQMHSAIIKRLKARPLLD